MQREMYLHCTWLSRWPWGEDWFSPQVLQVNPNSKRQQQKRSIDSVTCTSSISKLLHDQIRDSGRHTRSSCAFPSLVRHRRWCPSFANCRRGFLESLIGLYISPTHKNQNFKLANPLRLGHGAVVWEVTMPHQKFQHRVLDQISMLQGPPCWEILRCLHLANQIIKSDQSGLDSKTPHINSIFFHLPVGSDASRTGRRVLNCEEATSPNKHLVRTHIHIRW
jgi:hypothetical protein